MPTTVLPYTEFELVTSTLGTLLKLRSTHAASLNVPSALRRTVSHEPCAGSARPGLRPNPR